MNISVSLGIIIACITIASFVFGNIWRAATYKHGLEVLIGKNADAIKRQQQAFKYAYKLLETSHQELAKEVSDIQNFLVKTTDFEIRDRDKKPSNSGADFLEEAGKEFL